MKEIGTTAQLSYIEEIRGSMENAASLFVSLGKAFIDNLQLDAIVK